MGLRGSARILQPVYWSPFGYRRIQQAATLAYQPTTTLLALQLGRQFYASGKLAEGWQLRPSNHHSSTNAA
jgi:hypothetical protein